MHKLLSGKKAAAILIVGLAAAALYFLYAQKWLPDPKNYNAVRLPADVDLNALEKANSVKISRCVQDPPIAGVKIGGIFEFINMDAERHLLNFGTKDNYMLSGGRATRIRFDFVTEPMNLSYLCDGAEIGTIVILPN